jgi:microcystin-dependent protein
MSDQYIGEIRLFTGNYAPEGWALCDGTELPINGYQELFSLIGTTYGGDGQTTFRLPDLRGRIPIHAGTNPQTGTMFLLGDQGGVETVTLTGSQMPAHTHQVNVDAHEGTSAQLTGKFFANSNINQYSSNPANSTLSQDTVGFAGGNQPHDNMMPYLVLNFIIATHGLYPSQN